MNIWLVLRESGSSFKNKRFNIQKNVSSLTQKITERLLLNCVLKMMKENLK